MGDITYETLMAARKAKPSNNEEFDLMGMANMALKIMEQAQILKGGGGVMQSRPAGDTTTAQKPMIDAEQILGALATIKSLKGDLKITELESLIKEHKDQVTMLLGKI